MAAEFRGRDQRVPVAVEGTPGPLDRFCTTLAVSSDLQGEVAGRKAAVATKLLADDKGYKLDELRIAFGANALTGIVAVVIGGPRPSSYSTCAGRRLR